MFKKDKDFLAFEPAIVQAHRRHPRAILDWCYSQRLAPDRAVRSARAEDLRWCRRLCSSPRTRVKFDPHRRAGGTAELRNALD